MSEPIRVTANVTPADLAAARERAKANSRSLAAELGRLISQALKTK